MNEYADIKWTTGEYVVLVQHGSGDGRSYGGGEIYHNPASKPGWANNSQTNDWHVFATKTEADAKVNWANAYYDGSDYQRIYGR